MEDGLPINAVNGIVQDNNGYLYFSTLAGLARFDGYDFVTFNSSNSKGLNNDRIAGIMKAETGELWMISEAGALTVYRRGKFKAYTTDKGVAGRVLHVKEGAGNNLWIATSEGIAWLDRSTDKFIMLQARLCSTGTWAIAPAGSENVFGINKYGLVSCGKKGSDVLLKPEDFFIPHRTAIQLTAINEKATWVMGDEGFFLFKNGEVVPELSFSSEEENLTVWNVDEAEDDRYIFTGTLGLYEMDAINKSVEKRPVQITFFEKWAKSILYGKKGETILLGNNKILIDGEVVLESGEIRTGFVDQEGSIWIATNTGGVFQIRKSSFVNITSADDMPVENIYPIIQADDRSIWAGSFGGGIFRFRGREHTHWNTANSSLPNNRARYLFEDTDGTIYAGLWGEGLWKFDAGNERWVRSRAFDEVYQGDAAKVEAMYRDRSGRLIIGTQDNTVIGEKGFFRVYSSDSGKGIQGVRVIRESANGELFLGTNGSGLIILKGDVIQSVITEEQGLSSNFIRDIYLQADDTVWIATENRGLNRLLFNQQREVKAVATISTQDGLIDNSLHRIIEGPFRHLWISTNKGLMRISKSELNRYADGATDVLSVAGFDERDGMKNREANGGVQSAGILTADRRLWFPNQKGITIINPADSGTDVPLPLSIPVIEHISLSDSTIRVAGKSHIQLPKGERNIRFKFTAPNFAHPDRVWFNYRLSGVNRDWQSGKRILEAAYTNLEPGTYQFDIAAERIDGTSSETSVSVVIPPYFYETSWFYALLVTGILLMVYAGHKYRVRVLHRRKQVLQHRVDEQTKQLKEAAEQKSRFFTGITHELKTPLSLILGPLDDIVENHKSISKEDINDYHKMMQRSGYRLKNLIDQILDVSKLNADAIRLTLQPVDIEALTIQITGQFHSLLEQKNIRLEKDLAEIDEHIYVDKDAWERIIINLMSNAVKFSPEGERIILAMSEEKEGLSVSIKDFGPGIRRKDQQKVFEYLYQAEGTSSAEGTGIGLYLVKGLVERMGGTIKLQSEEGKGTECIVSLKKGYNHFDERDEVMHAPLVVNETLTPAEEPENPVSGKPETARVSEKTGRILIVEDNLDFRTYLHSILSAKYRVFLASEGKEALKHMDEFTPDLVISDVMMPGMGGLEFVNILRQKEPFKYLPIVFLSAKDQDVDVEAGLSTGADIYLTKPVRSNILLSQIAAVLRRERILKKTAPASARESAESTLELKVRKIVYRQLANSNLNIDMLADALHMSAPTLYRRWRQRNEITLNEFIKKVRLDESKVLLKEQHFSVQEAAYAVGFSNPNYFSTSFKKEFGTNPSEMT